MGKPSFGERFRRSARRIAPWTYRRVTGRLGPTKKQLSAIAERIAVKLMEHKQRRILDDAASSQLVNSEIQGLQDSMTLEYGLSAATKHSMDALGIKTNRKEISELVERYFKRWTQRRQADTLPERGPAIDVVGAGISRELIGLLGKREAKAKKLISLTSRKFQVIEAALSREIDGLMKEASKLDTLDRDKARLFGTILGPYFGQGGRKKKK